MSQPQDDEPYELPPESPEMDDFHRRGYAKIRAELTIEDLERYAQPVTDGVDFESVIADAEAEIARKRSAG